MPFYLFLRGRCVISKCGSPPLVDPPIPPTPIPPFLSIRYWIYSISVSRNATMLSARHWALISELLSMVKIQRACVYDVLLLFVLFLSEDVELISSHTLPFPRDHVHNVIGIFMMLNEKNWFDKRSSGPSSKRHPKKRLDPLLLSHFQLLF